MSVENPRFSAEALVRFTSRFLRQMNCSPEVAAEVAEHLVDADLCGVYSHGVFRLTQYAEQAAQGRLVPAGEPSLAAAEGGAPIVDGNRGFGIPAMRLAVDEAAVAARTQGCAAIGIANVGHTGRIGAFAEKAAVEGCLAIIFGGGARRDWPQVAPYGGAKGMLPTNPFAFAIPGGERGPVVLDFATAAGAGGKIYAARSAGRRVPPGLLIDAAGKASTDPEDYYSGGALLPMAGPKGYGMALIAELLGEAILGEVMDGLNWICICIDLARFRETSAYRRAAEQCLEELRNCPPGEGFERVEVPGEREARIQQQRLLEHIPIPQATVAELKATSAALGVACEELNRPA